MRQGKAICFVALATLTLLVPALINRSPFVFYDARHYLELGRSLIRPLHMDPPLIAVADQARAPSLRSIELRPGASGDTAGERGQAKPEHISLSYLGGRSPFYGLMLILIAGFLGIWPLAIMQASIAAWLAWLAVSAVQRRDDGIALPYFILILVLTAGSSLPYFAAYTMPDIFAGYSLASAALLACRAGSPTSRVALWMLLLFGAMAHATIPALLLVAALCSLRWLGLPWNDAWHRIAPSFSGAMAGFLAASLFSMLCLFALGDVPRSPPYLMARVLADGEGRAYLHDACRNPVRFAICNFRDRKLTDANQILWSTDPGRGVFNLADYRTRMLMADQEKPFVMHSVLYRPDLALAAAGGNAIEQIFKLGIGDDIGATKVSWDSMLFVIMPAYRSEITGSASYRGGMPYWLIDPAIIAAILGGAAFLIFRLGRWDVIRQIGASKSAGVVCAGPAFVCISLSLFAVLAANAVLCGVLSGPTERYQGRISWLILALAVLAWQALGSGADDHISREAE